MPHAAPKPGHDYATAERTQHTQPRVLVVDDEPAMAWGLQLNLTAEGNDVAVAESGQAALELHATFQPHVILLDLMLPDIHGLEVMSRIRKVDAAVRIVIVSCLIEPEQRAAGLKAGADDYQTKTFALDELLTRVRRQIERVRYSSRALLQIQIQDLARQHPDKLLLDRMNRLVLFRSAQSTDAGGERTVCVLKGAN